MNAIEIIKQLRLETGAGVMECRKAWEQCGQDFEQARDFLQEQSTARAAKQADRQTLDGRIGTYAHNNGSIGVMVEINTETDFASRSELFLEFVREIALQVTATSPLYIHDDEIPPHVLDELAAEASEKARRAGKPEKVIEKIVEGVLEKYKDQHVLLRQPYIRDEATTIGQLLRQKIAQVRENIVIRRFVRWEITPEAENEQA